MLTVNYYDDYNFKALIAASASSNFNYANNEIVTVPASQGQEELPGQDEFAFGNYS